MAKQVITQLIDDLEGGGADRTVEFAFDGVDYTIDLSEKNVGKPRKALDPFLGAATRVARTKSTTRVIGGRAVTSSLPDRQLNQKIREWALKNGYEVAERGRIPASVVEAYHSKR